MLRQELHFLDAALRVEDPESRGRLLAGHHLIRAACAFAEGRSLQEASLAAWRMSADVFEGEPKWAAHLQALEMALVSGDHPAVYAALTCFGTLLFIDGLGQSALAVFALAERLRDARCPPDVVLDAFYVNAKLLLDGGAPAAATAALPFRMATMARHSAAPRHFAHARALQVDRLATVGDLPRAGHAAERLLRFAQRSAAPHLVELAHLRCAVVHGRARRFALALAHATEAYRVPEQERALLESTLLIMGRVLLDLGHVSRARETTELALLHSRRRNRVLVLGTLIDIALVEGSNARARQLLVLARNEPPSGVTSHTYLTQMEACIETLAGNFLTARKLLEEGLAITRAAGHGYEFMEVDQELDRIAQLEARAASATPLDSRVHEAVLSISADHRRDAWRVQAVLA